MSGRKVLLVAILSVASVLAVQGAARSDGPAHALNPGPNAGSQQVVVRAPAVAPALMIPVAVDQSAQRSVAPVAAAPSFAFAKLEAGTVAATAAAQAAASAVAPFVMNLAETLPAVLPDAMVPVPVPVPVALPELEKLPLHQRISRRFERLDSDKNGSISREEAKRSRSLERHFDVVDADHDGEISPAELRNAWKTRMAARERARQVAHNK